MRVWRKHVKSRIKTIRSNVCMRAIDYLVEGREGSKRESF
jgi:hypothetical protein